jgi:uncharacterized RDD family membrane protein YckC
VTAPQMPTSCPVCGRDRWMGTRAKLLYGQAVCSKCHSAFANRRQAAFAVDTVIYGLVLTVAFSLAGVSDADTVRGTAFLLFPVFGLKDGFRGSSPGKALLGVQVVDERTGQPGGFGGAFKRNLILMVPFVPLIVAFTLGSGKRWGDNWAKTRVIWTKYRDRAPFAVIPAPA